jgi:hypothetical protein
MNNPGLLLVKIDLLILMRRITTQQTTNIGWTHSSKF